MIGQSLRLSTIRGIQVGVHYSWFILFLLITFSLVARFAGQHPRWTLAEHYVMAFLTSLLFFVSILLHELAHSFVALAKGIPVRAITLFVFGGVAQIGREPDRPAVEFQIAVAGPIASFVLAVAFGGLAAATEDRFEHLAALADWLASINLALAVFNLIPGFPLDGGRIFRAAVWQVTGSLTRATRIAARSGQLFAYVFMFGGIAVGFTANWFSGLWLAFIGWFLLNAAQESVLQASIRSVLTGLMAEDVMARDCRTIDKRTSLAELVDEHILRTGQRCFVVSSDGRIDGLVTLHQVKAIPRDRWAATPVEQAMTPLTELTVVSPDTPIAEVLQMMENRDIAQIPVTRSGRFLGMITRDHVLRVLSAKMELASPS